MRPETTAMGFDDAASDGKSHPHTVAFRGEKWLKELSQLDRRMQKKLDE